jgi:hypothetical protein
MWSDVNAETMTSELGGRGSFPTEKGNTSEGLKKNAPLSSFPPLSLWKSALKRYVLPEKSGVNTKCKIVLPKSASSIVSVEPLSGSFGSRPFRKRLSCVSRDLIDPHPRLSFTQPKTGHIRGVCAAVKWSWRRGGATFVSSRRVSEPRSQPSGNLAENWGV